jgi:hypothetical protein
MRQVELLPFVYLVSLHYLHQVMILVTVTFPVTSIQPRNRDTFTRRDHLYPPLAVLGSICHVLCRIEVESWFACRVCSEENQLIVYTF